MELSGRVKWFDANKGYGFIEPDDGGSDVFVHFGDLVGEGRVVIETQDRVQFDVGETPYGRRALRVRKVSPSEAG